MKMTFFIGSASGGGAERVMCELASSFAEKGNEVELLTVTRTDEPYKTSPGVRHVTLDSNSRLPKPFRIFVKMKRLKEYMKNCDADSYIVFLPLTVIAFLMYRKQVKGSVVISERNIPSRYPLLLQCVLYWISQRADGIVFQTGQAMECYRKRMKKMPLYSVIPNPVSSDFMYPYAGEKKKKIVSVGRLSKQKNFEMLICAFALFSEKYDDYTLEIYGEGNMRETLDSLAVSLNISEKVRLKGRTKNIRKAIENASLFVMTSDYEGMPNALIEAMATGLPCISTRFDGGGAEALIADGENGLLVSKNDTKGLCEAMERLVSDCGYAASLGKNAAGIISELNPQTIYSKWEDFVDLCTFKRSDS